MKSVVTTVQGSETFHSNNWSSAKSINLDVWQKLFSDLFSPMERSIHVDPPGWCMYRSHWHESDTAEETLANTCSGSHVGFIRSKCFSLRFCAVSVCEWNNQQLLCVQWISNHFWLCYTQLVHSGIFHFSPSAKRCADSHFVRSNSCKLETFSSAPAVRCLQC